MLESKTVSDQESLTLQLAIVFVGIAASIILGHLLDHVRQALSLRVGDPPPSWPHTTTPLIKRICDTRRWPSWIRIFLEGLVTALSESGAAVLLGLAVGELLEQVFDVEVTFNNDVFFAIILPPIIFYQGYSLKKKNFFRFIHYTLTLGVIGTLVQMAVTAGLMYGLNELWSKVFNRPADPALSSHEMLLLSSVFACADEVATLALIKQEIYPKLSAVLFGEGVVNDAVSILLFRSVVKAQDRKGVSGFSVYHVFVTAIELLVVSTLVGVGSGLLISRVMKVMPGMQEHPTKQATIMLLGSYLAYAVCELIGCPGVLAVFFCGVILSHYAWHSLSHEAQAGTAIFSHTLSTIAETYCFTALGLSMYQFEPSDWSSRYTLFLLIALVVGRALVVFGIFGFCGLFNRQKFSMSFPHKVILFVGGLVRGAITWAQALQIDTPHKGMITAVTFSTIVISIITIGGSLPFLLSYLGMTPSATTDIGEIEGVAHSTSQGAEERRWHVEIAGEEEVDGYHPLESARLSAQRPLLEAPPMPSMSVAPTMSYASDVSDAIIVHGRIHRWWTRFDEHYFKPIFGGSKRRTSARASGHIVIPPDEEEARLARALAALGGQPNLTPRSMSREYGTYGSSSVNR